MGSSSEGFHKIALDESGKRIVTAIHKIVQVWDAVTFRPIGQPALHERIVHAISFCSNDACVITKSGDARAAVWHAETGEQVGTGLNCDNDDPESNQSAYLDYGPPTTRAVVVFLDNTAQIFDVKKSWSSSPSYAIGPPLTHESGISGVYFHLAGIRVLTIHKNGTGQIFDAATGGPIGPPFRGPGDSHPGVSFSSDGKRIVVWSMGETTASVRETESGRAIGSPLRHDSYVDRAAFSPDGKRIITQCRGNTAQLWDAWSARPVGLPLRHYDAIHQTCFNADGKLVVTASADKTARVWDAATGLPIGPPMQHIAQVLCADFNLAGTRVITGCDTGTAHLWESVRGQSVAPPLDHGHDGEGIWEVGFSSDGAKIVTGSTKSARIWDAATGRDLTDLFQDAPTGHN